MKIVKIINLISLIIGIIAIFFFFSLKEKLGDMFAPVLLITICSLVAPICFLILVESYDSLKAEQSYLSSNINKLRNDFYNLEKNTKRDASPIDNFLNTRTK